MNSDFAQVFFGLFREPAFHRSVFGDVEGKPVQLCPVWLKDEAFNAKLIAYAEEADELMAKLTPKRQLRGLFLEPVLRSL